MLLAQIFKQTNRWIIGALLFATLSICYAEKLAPEIATQQLLKPLERGSQGMIVTNNPYASLAAQEIIDAGGNAFDAAIAAGFVLGLTEPQSSGVGGGGYALTYNGKTKQMTTYDGREVAPHTAKPDRFLDENGEPLPFKEAQWSAKSVGVPGEVMLFYRLHQKQGKLPWAQLLRPAIRLAKNGFKMSPRLYNSLKPDEVFFSENQDIQRVYFDGNQLKKIGSNIINRAYAKTLRTIANNPLAFYRGKLAKSIIHTINDAAEQNYFNLKDFANYQVKIKQPICVDYRKSYQLCTVPPSASGGMTVQMLMSIYADRYHGNNLHDPKWLFSFIEASKLAFADRDQYLADPGFVKVPVYGLLDKSYLMKRSKLIGKNASPTPVAAGKPRGSQTLYAKDAAPKLSGTTSLAVVDKAGNAISLTVTIESRFGSHIFTNGFFLNNELTDFSATPTDEDGKLVTNRVEAGKRPRSSIAPMFVFDKRKQLIAISGSPGGNEIICYVAKNLILMLDMKLLPNQASSTPNICSVNDGVEVEYTLNTKQLNYLIDKGEAIQRKELTSGVVNILRDTAGGWYGAADPRREGMAIALPSG